jgi:hypothetical protein
MLEMNRISRTGPYLLLGCALLSLSTACDGPTSYDYVVESDKGLWAVPMPPYPARLNYYDGNEARWIPAWSERVEPDDEALYRVGTIAGLNQAPQHPVAVFRPGYEWQLICPQIASRNEHYDPTTDPQVPRACTDSVSRFESGSILTGGHWHKSARATVRLREDALESEGVPTVRCRGEDVASATCSVAVQSPSITACTVDLVRLWAPGETDHHRAGVKVERGDEGAQLLEWPLVPNDWIPKTLRESVARKRRRDVPPNSFALVACQNDEKQELRFVAAPVVVDLHVD